VYAVKRQSASEFVLIKIKHPEGLIEKYMSYQGLNVIFYQMEYYSGGILLAGINHAVQYRSNPSYQGTTVVKMDFDLTLHWLHDSSHSMADEGYSIIVDSAQANYYMQRRIHYHSSYAHPSTAKHDINDGSVVWQNYYPLTDWRVQNAA